MAFVALLVITVATPALAGDLRTGLSNTGSLNAGASKTASAEAVSLCRKGVFPASFRSSVEDLAQGRFFTAAVHDTRSDCWYYLNQGLELTTASAIKATVLAAVLARSQVHGGGSLTADEADAAERMIRWSHNSTPTSWLYGRVGLSGMRAYSTAVGASSVVHSTSYGATRATAADLALLAESMLHLGGDLGPLTDASRKIAWEYMSNVHPTQQFGITAGVPAEYEVALKNGFYVCRNGCAVPEQLRGVYRWRIASTGFVRQTGTKEGYAIAILTDGSATQSGGVELVEFISRQVAKRLLEGEPAARLYDQSNCVEATGQQPASELLELVGLANTAAQWSQLLWTSGNEGPFTGQLLCADELIPPRQRANRMPASLDATRLESFRVFHEASRSLRSG